MRKVFIDEFPKWESGANKGRINWRSCISLVIRFIYDEIQGEIKILNYDSKSQQLTVEYNKKEQKIKTNDLAKGKLGGVIGTKTKDFKIEIGQVFKDDKRNFTIIDREYKKINKASNKWYKFNCNVCGWTEGWMNESNLLGGNGCICCAKQKLVIGINDIPTTTPWMIKYFQAGCEEAKLYTKNGGGNPHNKGGYIYPVCPDCGKIKENSISISNIHKNHSIGCSCSDKIPYGEKFIINLLQQLNVSFQTQLTKTTFKWCKNYKYDFYFELNGESFVIEVNGMQHYEDVNGKWRVKLKEQKQIDKLKKELALKNGIKEENYIIIDCRYSELEWIKNNKDGILNSNLAKLFDLSKIDWLKAEEFTCTNLIKIACELKRNNPELTTTEIGKLMKMSKSPIRKYLKKGNNLGWCNYNAELERIKTINKRAKYQEKPIKVFKDNIFIGEFESAQKLEKCSENLFGIKIDARRISDVCRKRFKQYKGFVFEYSTWKEIG